VSVWRRECSSLLGGKDNYAADREQAERIVALNRRLPGLVRDSRVFIIKTVTRAASQLGIRQFIDLGAGLPTHPSVHEAAQEVSPDARVAYVDNDPVVQSHVRALLAGDGIAAVGADITRPAEVLGDPELARVIDFGQPVCVILASVLHFQPAGRRRGVQQAGHQDVHRCPMAFSQPGRAGTLAQGSGPAPAARSRRQRVRLAAGSAGPDSITGGSHRRPGRKAVKAPRPPTSGPP
jgi:S-adenosyl methyltransferase